MNYIDMTGQIFNTWKAVRFFSKNGTDVKWLCACIICGFERPIWRKYLLQGRKHLCEECDATMFIRLYGAASRRAKEYNCKFTISKKDLQNQWNKQNGKCALTGLPLIIVNKRRRSKEGNTSIDRIDSSKGYEPYNIQFVHKDLNYMKNDFTQYEFIKYCNLVAKQHPVINL